MDISRYSLPQGFMDSLVYMVKAIDMRVYWVTVTFNCECRQEMKLFIFVWHELKKNVRYYSHVRKLISYNHPRILSFSCLSLVKVKCYRDLASNSTSLLSWPLLKWWRACVSESPHQKCQVKGYCFGVQYNYQFECLLFC